MRRFYYEPAWLPWPKDPSTFEFSPDLITLCFDSHVVQNKTEMYTATQIWNSKEWSAIKRETRTWDLNKQSTIGRDQNVHDHFDIFNI